MKYFERKNWTDPDTDGVRVGKIIGHTFLWLFLFITFCGFWGTVGAGKRGVLLHFGAVQEKVFDEGLYFKFPFIQEVIEMDVTTQKQEMKLIDAASKDMQEVTTDIAVNYYLDPTKVNRIYQKLRKDYIKRVINPALEEFVKKTTAEFAAEELITKRSESINQLTNSISTKLAENNIIVENVFITNFEFSPQFNAAIEAKVTAEQKALQAINDLERIKVEAEQKVTQARADAEAIRIQAEAITSQGGKDYVSLQWIAAWEAGGSQVPHMILGEGGSNFLLELTP